VVMKQRKRHQPNRKVPVIRRLRAKRVRDEKHLDILRQGVEVWNEWRKKHKDIVPDLSGADLSTRKLAGVDLSKAELFRADLSGAELFGADLREAKLSEAKLRGTDLSGANLRRTALLRVDLGGEARLSGANLSEASLEGAILRGAKLARADLSGADLSWADLREAELFRSNLKEAKLVLAKLNEADLSGADLSEADLRRAVLHRANLEGAQVNKTSLAFADLTEATYAPASPPPDDYLEGIKGLGTVTFPPGQYSGLVQLRKLLRDRGLRDEERAVTRAIERTDARHARRREGQDTHKYGFKSFLRGVAKCLAFEWTIDYGLKPGRALILILLLIVLMTMVYMPVIKNDPSLSWVKVDIPLLGPAVIYKDLPRDQRETPLAGTERNPEEPVQWPTTQAPGRIQPLTEEQLLPALGWAFWFSVRSAFLIGFQQFSVGDWLARLQPNEFTFRASGWVRMASGVQSLLSLYLVAIWALSYFGRPFG
jgi:uncharacterized protein YjbI with pentapeptide repeats